MNKKFRIIIVIAGFLVLTFSACKKEEEPNPVKYVQTIHFSDYDCIINYNSEKLPISIYYDHLNGSVELVSEMEYHKGKIVRLLNYGLDKYIAWGTEKEVETIYNFMGSETGRLTSIYANRWFVWPLIVTYDMSNNIIYRDETNKTVMTFNSSGNQDISTVSETDVNSVVEFLETDNMLNMYKFIPKELRCLFHICPDFENRLTEDINFGPFLSRNPITIRKTYPDGNDSVARLIKYSDYEYQKSFLPTAYTRTTFSVEGADTVQTSQVSITIDYSEGF